MVPERMVFVSKSRRLWPCFALPIGIVLHPIFYILIHIRTLCGVVFASIFEITSREFHTTILVIFIQSSLRMNASTHSLTPSRTAFLSNRFSNVFFIKCFVDCSILDALCRFNISLKSIRWLNSDKDALPLRRLSLQKTFISLMAIGVPPFVAVALPLLSLLQISVRLIAIGIPRLLRWLSLLKILISIY